MRELRQRRLGAALLLGALLVAAMLGFVAIEGWIAPEGAEPVAGPPQVTEAPSRALAESIADSTGTTVRELASSAAAPASETNLFQLFLEEETLPGEPVDVLVVEGATGAPVPGAELRWANVSEYGPLLDVSRPSRNVDAEQVLAAARRATTDEQGRAQIDTRVFPGIVVARRGNAWGSIDADDARKRSLRIEIVPDVDLVIEVVDERGRPVTGVPVGIRATRDADLMGTVLWRGSTDASGRAAVRTLSPERSPGTVYAYLGVLTHDPLVVPIDMTDVPRAPARFVLPPCGSVLVDLRDSLGRPVTADSVELHETASHSPVSIPAESIVIGLASFPFVALGLDLRVSATRFAWDGSGGGPGPIASGESVRFEIVLGPPSVVLNGRLVDESGQPKRRLMIRCRIDGLSSPRPSRTDDDGRFVHALAREVGLPLNIALTCTPQGPSWRPGMEGQVSIEVPVAPPILDVGDIVLRVPKVIASGIVVDESGQPVPEAVLVVEFSRRDVAGGAWHKDRRCFGGGDSRGGFTVESTMPADRVRVLTLKSGYSQDERVEMDAGTRDARIVLWRASSVAGTVMFDAGISPTRVQVRVVPSDAPRDKPQVERIQTKLGDDGRFALKGLHPGHVDLLVVIDGQAKPVLTLRGVELPPGGRATDGRLDALDLRGLVQPQEPASGGRVLPGRR